MATQDSQQQAHWHFSQFEDENIKIRGRTLFTLLVLLSIGILATLLFLYVRWICRRHNHPTVIILPITTPNQSLQGLDTTTINNLPIVSYKSLLSGTGKYCPADEITECCICLSVFGDGENVKMLPECRHCFHSECVDIWLVSHPSCPLCRLSLNAHLERTSQIVVTQ